MQHSGAGAALLPGLALAAASAPQLVIPPEPPAISECWSSVGFGGGLQAGILVSPARPSQCWSLESPWALAKLCHYPNTWEGFMAK